MPLPHLEPQQGEDPLEHCPSAQRIQQHLLLLDLWGEGQDGQQGLLIVAWAVLEATQQERQGTVLRSTAYTYSNSLGIRKLGTSIYIYCSMHI